MCFKDSSGILEVFRAFEDFGDFFHLNVYRSTENFTKVPKIITKAPKYQNNWRGEFISIARISLSV